MEQKVALQQLWNCPSCGYQNEPSDVRCEKCGRSLQLSQSPAGPRSNLAVLRTSNPSSAGDGARQTSARSPQPVTPLPENVRKQIRRQIKNSVEDFLSRKRDGSLPLQFEE